MNCATALPSTNATTYGIDLSAKDETSSGLVSEFTLTSVKRPPYSRSSFSRTGPSGLQGPHQGAQKSTSTGTSIEASMTSRSNEDSVVSIMTFPPVPYRARKGRCVSERRAGIRVGRAHEPRQDSSYLPDNG